jgi:zinc protease
VKSKKFKKLLAVCLLFACYFLSAARAEALDAKRNVLPNGLVLLHSENHSLPIVMVTLIVKAGQIDEPKEKAGLANLLSELLTEGTEKRKSKDISEETDFIGASLDASAGGDYTTVTLSVLKKDVHKGFDLFSDILLHPVFPQAELERKREQIKGLLKQREEEPSFLAERAFKKEVFGEHPYGRLIEGSPETIDVIKRDDFVEFHSNYFLPNNSILSVAGDLTSHELDELMNEYLAEWKPRGLVKKDRPRPDEKKIKKVIKIDKDLTQANIILGNPGISRDNPDYYAVAVMNYIFGGGGFSSRLMHSIREKMGLAYDVHSFFAAYKEGGSFQIGLQTKNESANTTIGEILKQTEGIMGEYVSDEELSDAKSYLTGSFKRRLDTTRKIADFIASVEFYNLGLDYDKKYPEYINAVTKDNVLRVAKKYLATENFVLVVVANQKKAGLKY